MGYKLLETLGPLVAPSLRSGRYSFRALWSLFHLYPYVLLSNYYLFYMKLELASLNRAISLESLEVSKSLRHLVGVSKLRFSKLSEGHKQIDMLLWN